MDCKIKYTISLIVLICGYTLKRTMILTKAGADQFDSNADVGKRIMKPENGSLGFRSLVATN